MSSTAMLRALIVPAVLAPLLLALVAYGGWRRGQANGLDDFGPAPAFALTDQQERSVSSEQLRGKVIVANFIYTNCPDVCPLLSLHMQELQRRLRQEGLLGSQAQLLSFTTDPARDTPAVVRAYAEQFQADPAAWRFLAGSVEEMTPLVEQGFHLTMQPLPVRTSGQPDAAPDEAGHDNYEVMHGTRFALIDRQWRVRAWYAGQEFDLERVVRDIRTLAR